MMFDPRQHHRRSIRLRGYDYRQAGAYFVTICTDARACLFGEVIEGVVHLSNAGEKTLAAWYDLPNHHPGVELDGFVVMPNHVHGILILPPAELNDVESTERFGHPRSGSLGTIVRSFKSAVSRAINADGGTDGGTVWQRNYFERIIRSETMLNAVREYIVQNPVNWARDEEHPGHRPG